MSNVIYNYIFFKKYALEDNDWKRVDINEDFCGWDGIMVTFLLPNCFSFIISFNSPSRGEGAEAPPSPACEGLGLPVWPQHPVWEAWEGSVLEKNRFLCTCPYL